MILGSRNTPSDRLRSENSRLWRENKRLRRDNEKMSRRLEKTETQLTKAKEPTLGQLKKRAWGWFSKWVRINDDGVCFTCSTKYPWKEMDAGHYIDASICGVILNFFPRNVHAQCSRCNRWLHGKKSSYRANMVTVYGQAKVDHLDLIRTRTVGIFKPSREYYLAIARKYKTLVSGLEEEMARLDGKDAY